MADMIARLKVDSSEYDSKVKRAADGILNLERTIREAGESFLATWKDEQNFAKGLGQMETVSKTARGKISELTSAFTEMSLVYKRMTDEEKNSPFGKNLSQSLDQLKVRINDAKKDLSDIDKELKGLDNDGNNTSGVLDQLAGKFGLNAKQLTTWGAALAAGKVALDTIKGAIESTEAGHDALARTMLITDSVTNQFLRTLATADFSTFINGLQGIINKATEAYNTLDEFESFAARFNPYQQAKESEIQTKLMQARASKAQGDKEKAERLTNEAKALIDQLAASTKAYGEKQTKSGFASIRNLMGGVEISDQQIAWYADPKNWEKAKEKADKYEKTLSRIQYLSKEVSTGKKPGETDAGVSIRHFSAREELRRLQQELKSDPSLKRAYTMQNLRDSGDSDQAQQLRRALGDIYGNTLAQSRIESLRARADRMDGVIMGRGTIATTKLTDPEKAQEKYDQAIKDYNQALEQAKMEVDAGRLNAAEAKKKELAAEEALWKAIGDAREIYDNPKLQEEQAKVADKVKSLGGSVNALIEEQKKAQEAARQLASAQKKLSDAQTSMADALNANDYKAYTAAYQQYNQANAEVQRLQPKQFEPVTYEVEARTESALDAIREVQDITIDDKDVNITVTANTQEAVDALRGVEGITLTPKVVDIKVNTDNVKGTFTYTENNMEAFIRRLHTNLANADLGSELYKNLTAQLADAQTLANLLQVAVKNGIDIAQFDPQTLFNKIFGENPGDYIEDAKWEEVRKKIEELVGKPITIDVNTGTVNVDNKQSGKNTQGKSEMTKLVGNVSTITGALNQLGVEIPEGFQKTLGVLQVISTITMAIQSLAAVTATTSALKAIPVIGWFLQNGGVIHAQSGFSGIVPGNSLSGDTVPALLNSGETVLTAGQSATVANLLTNRGNDNYGVGETRIESDQMVLLLRNGAQAKGMTIGEYLGL